MRCNLLKDFAAGVAVIGFGATVLVAAHLPRPLPGDSQRGGSTPGCTGIDVTVTCARASQNVCAGSGYAACKMGYSRTRDCSYQGNPCTGPAGQGCENMKKAKSCP
jgi:hypothetical protein